MKIETIFRSLSLNLLLSYNILHSSRVQDALFYWNWNYSLTEPMPIFVVRGLDRRSMMWCNGVVTALTVLITVIIRATGKTIQYSMFFIQRLQTFAKFRYKRVFYFYLYLADRPVMD